MLGIGPRDLCLSGKDFVPELHSSSYLQAFKTYINNIHTIGNPSVCTVPGAGNVTQLVDAACRKPWSPSLELHEVGHDSTWEVEAGGPEIQGHP